MTKRKRQLGRYVLRVMLDGTGGYPKGYRPILSHHNTLENAIEWGRRSGMSAWPEGDRLGRVWIEDPNKPATI